MSGARDLKAYSKRFKDPAKAQKYARRFARGSRKRTARREEQAVRSIFSKIPDCRSVLDVPAGAGRFLAILGSTGRRVIEADVSHEILKLAQKHAEETGVPAQCLHADAARLPLAAESVDAVFCNRLLHHLPSVEDRRSVLCELHRVSRRYVVVSFFDYHAFGAFRRWLKALKGAKPRYAGQPTFPEFQSECERCGFRVGQVVPIGPCWVAQKYLVLEKSQRGPGAP